MQLIHQKPCPRINIYSPDSKASYGAKATPKLTFDISNISSLQSYSFSLSTDDISGSFNLVFFPDNAKTTTAAGEAKTEALFDKIGLLDIVQVYEDYPALNILNGVDAAIGTSEGEACPVFTGIIRSKKYAATGSESGVMRRLSVSGTAITGLVSQFRLSMDVTAQAVTKIGEASSEINANLVNANKASAKIKDVIANVWTEFLRLSETYGTPTIAGYIGKWLGDAATFFDVEDMEIGYPLAALFASEATEDFFSIVEKILPAPYYEKSAYTDDDGNMKIRLRRCPFDAYDWIRLDATEIPKALVKSFDVAMTDNEVYTVFLAYLEGSSISEREYLVTAINDAKSNNYLYVDEDKFGKYGYRPLFIHCRGYNPPSGADERSEAEQAVSDYVQTATSSIKSWHSNLDEMLAGSITLALAYRNETSRIMPGDRVRFLGNEFYVDGISHSWTYNGGGEINLSVSRGGVYNGGEWSKGEGLTAYARVRG